MKHILRILLTIVILMLSLVGCSEKTNEADFESKLAGIWYLEGSQEVAFVLYSDNTCEIAGEYGTGIWSVVNENQLKLTNYYGETETAIIVKIDNSELVLSDGNVKSYFSNKPGNESKVEEIITDNEKEDIFEADTKKTLDHYVLQTVINPSYKNMPFTIDSDEHFWVEAVSIENEKEHRMLNINLDGEIFFDIPFISATNISMVEDKYICKGNSAVYNLKGIDISSSFCSENEQFGGVFEDTTGWTVWLWESIDTYDSHEFIIKAINLDGTAKAEWSQKELDNKYEGVNLSNEIKLLGGSWYRCGDMIFNLENKIDIWCQGVDYCGADDDFLYLCYSDGWLSRDSIIYYDKFGNNVTPALTFLEYDSFWYDRYLGEGMMLLENHDMFIVFNSTGKIPFDVNRFAARGTWGDTISINSFHNGKAQIEMVNESGVKFTTLIDSKGEFLFEPIEGTISDTYYINMWKYKYLLIREANALSCLMDDVGNLIKNSGELYIKEGEYLTSYITIENGQLAIYPVEHIN